MVAMRTYFSAMMAPGCMGGVAEDLMVALIISESSSDRML